MEMRITACKLTVKVCVNRNARLYDRLAVKISSSSNHNEDQIKLDRERLNRKGCNKVEVNDK